jgi:molecular chaperone DnaK
VALGAAVQTQLKDNDYQVMLPGAPKKAKPEKIGGVVAQEKKIAAVGLLQVKDVSTHAMGIIAVNPAGTEYINEIIIPANNPIPVKLAQSFHFYTSSREPNELDIFVLQGDRPRPLENAIPYKYAVSGIRHVKGGKTLMRIQYSYDPNGVIHVQARQEDDAADLPIRTEPVPDDMSKYGRPVEAEEMRPAETSVLLAVDVSGCMAGEPLDDAKKAMCSFVDQMDMSSTRVGIIAVSDSSEVVQRLTDNAEKCKKAIRGIICGQTGYGNFTHPFKTIREEFEKVEGRRFAIILADGVWADQPKAVSSARKCHQAEIETAAIGFGGADEQFLRDISSSDANALMTSQGELTRAFGKIAQSIGSGKKGQERDVANTKAWETEWEGANGEKSF